MTDAVYRAHSAFDRDLEKYEREKEEISEEEPSDIKFIISLLKRPIIVFILFTYLGWFQWNKDTGLRKIIKAIIQFIFSIIIGFIWSYWVAAFRILF